MPHAVLIIDDDPAFVETTTTLLTAEGYKVDSASNGKVGIAKAGEQKPDIILLDLVMSANSKGLEVARKLNKNKDLAKIPVVIVTNAKRAVNLPFGFEANDAWLPVKGVLAKPVKPAVLLKTIAQCIADHRHSGK